MALTNGVWIKANAANTGVVYVGNDGNGDVAEHCFRARCSYFEVAAAVRERIFEMIERSGDFTVYDFLIG